jgi:hypothetical protein
VLERRRNNLWICLRFWYFWAQTRLCRPNQLRDGENLRARASWSFESARGHQSRPMRTPFCE